MINVAYARPQDTAAVKALWGEAFGTDEPYFSWYFENIYRAERTLCLFVENTMAASVQYAPYTLKLHDKKKPVAYLVGVCTSPPYQHRGYAHILLRYLINDLRDAYRFLMLYTDIPGFYQAFGFSHCYYLRRHILSAGVCPGILRRWDTAFLTDADINHCDQIYQKMTVDLDGYIIRSPAEWRHFFEDFLCDGGSLFLSEDAYLLWMIDEGVCKIKEIGYTNKNALDNALIFGKKIAKKEGFATLIWDAPLAAPLLVSNTTLVPHVMVLSCGCTGSPAVIAAHAKKCFNDPTKLWVNEIT